MSNLELERIRNKWEHVWPPPELVLQSLNLSGSYHLRNLSGSIIDGVNQGVLSKDLYGEILDINAEMIKSCFMIGLEFGSRYSPTLKSKSNEPVPSLTELATDLLNYVGKPLQHKSAEIINNLILAGLLSRENGNTMADELGELIRICRGQCFEIGVNHIRAH